MEEEDKAKLNALEWFVIVVGATITGLTIWKIVDIVRWIF